MKNDVMPSIVQMEAEELQKLTAVVKETIAGNFKLVKQKPSSRSFGTVDLWNIRRNARSASGMMRR
ncbi:MAG: hypothetical protein ABUT20_37705 [Bacteroidota bacterium]